MSNDPKPYQADRLNRPFEGHWAERSGDSRVAYVETQRELRSEWPSESVALKRAFAGSARDQARAAKLQAAKAEQDRALRERFAVFRAARKGAE